MDNLKKIAFIYIVNSSSGLYNVVRAILSLIDKSKINQAVKKKIPFVLIYQQGRVASTSVYESIKAIKLPYPLYHVHTISAKTAQKGIEKLKQKKGKIYRHFFVGKFLSQALIQKRKEPQAPPWKIITIFRDPLEVMLSLHFLNMSNKKLFVSEGGQLDNEMALRHYETLFINDEPAGWEICKWFDEVFLDETGVDVYLTPFDYEKGYTIINAQECDILIIKFEDIKKAYKYGVAELFDINPADVELQHANLHSNDDYKDIHKYVKQNLKFSSEFCDKVYSTKLIKHFYSPQQILNLKNKWGEK